jgi:hypothetical protein
MATVHIRDIQRWLQETGHEDTVPWSSEFFLEIRFDESGGEDVVDEEMRNRLITGDTRQGTVTITFDESGFLRSLDIS